MNTFKIIPSVEKKMINGKQRYDFLIKIIKNKTVYFAQADSNIWWKPRKIKLKDDGAKGISVGWLFLQIGKLRFL